MKGTVHYISLLLFTAVVSCQGLEPEENFVQQGNVEVCLSLSAEPQIEVNLSSSPAVKADDGSDVSDNEIKNLWVLQYNGLTDSAKLLGEALYIDDLTGFDGRVKLVATDDACSIYLIANTFEPGLNIPSESTVADLKTRMRELTSQDNEYLNSRYKILSADGNGKYYPIFSGFIQTGDEGVFEGAEYTVDLKRNVSKVTITVRNQTTGTEAVTVKSVRLCSAPSVSYYLAGIYGESDIFPSETGLSFGDYEAVAFPADASSVSVVYYVPVNMRGTVPDNTSELYKNRYAPKGATHLLVSAEYTDNGHLYPIEYSFYLGSDMVRDFNMKPNGSYEYEFTISKRGNADVDLRIEDWGIVDFSDTRYEPANCYILNPVPDGNSPRHFRIPILRAKTFWGTDTRREYEDNAELGLRDKEGSWTAWILASDFDIDGNNFKVTESSGNNAVDRYFEVAVAPGTGGNVIVAVGPEIGKISWSWHLWITDYDPYECLDWNDSRDGQYMYPVRNGNVHRYEGDFWRLNRSAYIMDRNLGALSVEYPDDLRGLVYYQFGRKDPFFCKSSIYKYPDSQTYKRTNVSFDTANTQTSEYPNGVAYSVRNPLTFIKSYGADNTYHEWTDCKKYNSGDLLNPMLWQDPHTAKGMAREEEKSIFDPCPPGYSLPEQYIWSDFRHNNDTDLGATTNTFPHQTDMSTVRMVNGFADFIQNKGLQYWPYQGENVLIPDNVVFYPACGYLHPNTGSAYNSYPDNRDCWTFLWSKNDAYTNSALGMTAQYDHLAAPNETPRSRALPVRCITDR